MDNTGFLIVIAVLIGIILFSFSNFSPLSSTGSGPLATGPGSGTEIQNPQPVMGEKKSFLNSIRSITAPSSSPSPSKVQSPSLKEHITPQKAGYSRYDGAIRISHVSRSGTNPAMEYITLRNGGFLGFGSTDQPIGISGWTIENSRHEKFPISKAYNIPFVDADSRDILLPSGGQVHVVTGRSNLGVNFRENGCTGYLNQYYQFTPSLPNSCIDRMSSSQIRSLFLDQGLSGSCIDYVSSLPACKIPTYNFEATSKLENACLEYVSKNFSYSGCVKNYRDEKSFLKNTWRVNLNRPEKLYNERHDRIIVRDELGLIVDEFEY